MRSDSVDALTVSSQMCAVYHSKVACFGQQSTNQCMHYNSGSDCGCSMFVFSLADPYRAQETWLETLVEAGVLRL